MASVAKPDGAAKQAMRATQGWCPRTPGTGGSARPVPRLIGDVVVDYAPRRPLALAGIREPLWPAPLHVERVDVELVAFFNGADISATAASVADA